MSKWTKGPWVVEGNKIGIVDSSDTQAFGMLSVIAIIDEYDCPEYQANKHLIKTAPELANVAQLVLDVDSEGASDRVLRAILVALQYQARKALAGARGEKYDTY